MSVFYHRPSPNIQWPPQPRPKPATPPAAVSRPAPAALKWTTIGDRWSARTEPVTEPNPFKRDDHGKIGSPSAIAVAIKKDPSRAREMCRAAGERPSDWFQENPR